ncbi:hypothetical protein OH77DRAFT_1389783, partial [Trametes cingulata]
WWPWLDKSTCLLDVTGAFPRSLFSESELRGTRWVAAKSGSRSLPSVRQVKNSREKVLAVAGTSPRHHSGRCGHLYATADLPTIIEHEFANPLVRSTLQLYPVDAGQRLSHPSEAQKWADEVDPDLAAPMARSKDGKDFFVNELAMANIDDLGQVGLVVPTRWFQRDGVLLSRACPVRLRSTSEGQTLLVDARDSEKMEIPLTSYVLNVLDLLDPEVQRQWALPSPDKVNGVICSDDPRTPVDLWRHAVQNEWRVRGNGKRVYALPLWLYCDDTSGNVSKKWNKHNSVLFVLGGLPRHMSQLMYNVHFLSTSNLASPLEMMEQISAVLQDASTYGIEVWDCEHQEQVLVIPWVLAFQGDNPMASEFASHIGMKGKYLCRVCHARADESDRSPGLAGERERLAEFMNAVFGANVLRVDQSGRARTKAETLEELKRQEQRAFDGAPSAVDSMATETGVKDKYFQHYVDKLQMRLNNWREQEKRLGGAMPAPEEMPENIFNPVLQLRGMVPNADSPFEALHVVLLGVVKYWWRDACARQDQRGKATLTTRLSSVDVSGLGVSRLRGHTLVHYAGSLVGRDFRVIVQVAPSVLHGLLPGPAYEAWLALSRLAPLIFQPEIEDLPEYEKRLERAIEDFLAATALWTTQWFNKPKFHLFVHLLKHIRRFGPAILFATETFESYNLVIRLRSVNSNKHAPSLDIARSFSHLHAVRHLVSGGYVMRDVKGEQISPRQAGEGVLSLLHDQEFRDLMSMSRLFPQTRAGYYHPLDSKAPQSNKSETASFKAGVSVDLPERVVRCRTIILGNEDRVSVGMYVAYALDEDTLHGALLVGHVEEILVDLEDGRSDGVLLTCCRIGEPLLPYRMPACHLEDKKAYIPFDRLVAAVSTIHNCAAHGCTPTRTKVVVQERRETEEREDEILHTVEPMDRMLNTAQLRNAHLFHRIVPRPRFPAQAQASVIEAAIERRVAAQHEAEQRRQVAAQRKAQRGGRQRTRTRRDGDSSRVATPALTPTPMPTLANLQTTEGGGIPAAVHGVSGPLRARRY